MTKSSTPIAGAVLVGTLIGCSIWWVQQHRTQTAAPAAAAIATAPAADKGSAQIPAAIVADAVHAPILAAAWAGKRVVAAGDHGVILLSDDAGKTFRQARSVPSQALLTSLSFIDEHRGWAAGHDGLVLHTEDAGETWTIQREDLDGDKPLFAIHFKDAGHGLAVGLFGTAVQTADGGKTWTPLEVETGEEKDHHLYAIFGAPDSGLYIAGEAGLLYRSADGGASWTTIKTSNPGSFWTGAQLRDGSLLAAGQRGHVFLSHDQGASWSEAPSGTDQSLTGVAQNADGSLILSGLAGTTLRSGDGGASFTAANRDDRVPLNAVLARPDGKPLLFGEQGPVSGE